MQGEWLLAVDKNADIGTWRLVCAMILIAEVYMEYLYLSHLADQDLSYLWPCKIRDSYLIVSVEATLLQKSTCRGWYTWCDYDYAWQILHWILGTQRTLDCIIKWIMSSWHQNESMWSCVRFLLYEIVCNHSRLYSLPSVAVSIPYTLFRTLEGHSPCGSLDGGKVGIRGLQTEDFFTCP